MSTSPPGVVGEGPDVLVDAEDRIVRRFEGRAGVFPDRTLELVTFELSAVTFEHPAGPFSTCLERFDLRSGAAGATVLVHSGTLQFRGGRWTWAVLGSAVRRAFETHVRHHLQAMRHELESPSGGADPV